MGWYDRGGLYLLQRRILICAFVFEIELYMALAVYSFFITVQLEAELLHFCASQKKAVEKKRKLCNNRKYGGEIYGLHT